MGNSMRQFVILGHDVQTDGDFSLDNLTGVGRVDLLARCVTASLLLSHGIRESVRTHLVLADEFTVRFDGSSLRGLHPDERSTAALIRNALEEQAKAIGHVPVETSPGVTLVRRGFEETLEALADAGTPVLLHEDGSPAGETAPPADPVFVLSDHQEFTQDERQVCERLTTQTVRLGPRAVHADHAITVAHNWCDTDGFTVYS